MQAINRIVEVLVRWVLYGFDDADIADDAGFQFEPVTDVLHFDDKEFVPRRDLPPPADLDYQS